MVILGEYQTSVQKALTEIDKKWKKYPGLIACGSHSGEDADEIIQAIKENRESGLPFLGICFGHQLAVIEYARNILGIKDATSEELSDTGTFVVKKRDGLKVGLKDGESYWNNFEVAIDWSPPKNYVTCQFHPEYQSAIDKHHPLLVKFLDLCKQG